MGKSLARHVGITAGTVALALLLFILNPGRPAAGQQGAAETSKATKLQRTHPRWYGEPVRASAYTPVSPSRLLVTAGDTLYMLDSTKRIVWKWSAAASLAARPIVLGGTIYGIAFDGILFAVDTKSGALKWNNQMMGKAAYSQIRTYKQDTYLVVVDLAMYEHDHDLEKKDGKRTTSDKLQLFKGNKPVWEKLFPPDAKLEVWGDRILAVQFAEEGVEITEIPH